MKIKSISCTQFAGIRDRSLSFDDGINLIYGKNESGKSTLVNLLSRTLFQNAHIDGRSDKTFKDLYFPGARKGSSITGDFADGKITFDTDQGTYTLTKEWGSDARCTLSTPDGVIRDQKKIDAILKEVLLYGEGVYSDMLFSSQRNTDISLQTILDASKKSDAKQEITDAVSRAFSESDGITTDAIEQAITKKITEIKGEHWDLERDLPKKKAGGGRWSVAQNDPSKDQLLKAYYAVEDAKAVLEAITHLEKDADAAAADYAEKNGVVRSAEAAYERFQTFAGQLTVQSERLKAISRLENEASKLKKVISDWPRLEDAIEKATELKTEKRYRTVLDMYAGASKLSDEIDFLRSEWDGLDCPTNDEIAAVRGAQRKIATLENKLCGINLSAAIKMFGENSITITSLRTGETLDISDGVASITEAVKITVPGVMEMQLSPADVDARMIERTIKDLKLKIMEVFNCYKVEDLEELEALAKEISDAKTRIETLSTRLSAQLGALDYSELKATVRAIPDGVRSKVRSKEEIEKDIRTLCGSSDIEKYITAKETVIEGYVAEYTSIDAVKARAYDTEMELKRAQETVQAVQDIPAEYANISDPEGYLTKLQNELKSKQATREAALTAKTTAAGKLESYKEHLSGDPVAEAENAERIFAEKKALLDHWMHIAQVFAEQKQNVQNNPMQDISDSFTRYLRIISGGKVSSEFPDPEKLNMSIYSDNKLLDYGKLSEGTKETVSLAFRLAVLDHLFPNGGGVIVLDDPFTDMDADRTAQSCELIKECAQRHQVIFLTCKEEYADMLGGNEIRM